MKLGIKDLSEGVRAGLEIGVRGTKLFKDGVQISDFEQFYAQFVADPEFKSIVKAGWEGRENIVAEAKDLDLQESAQVLVLLAGFVKRFIDALK